MSATPLERTWTLVGTVDDVPLLEGRSVEIEGRRIAVFRLPDGWAAVDHACPHRDGQLADGLVADACVTCPLHGRRFDLATGREQGGDLEIGVHEVEVRDGALLVRLRG